MEISFTIKDKDDIEFLKNLDEKERVDYIRGALTIGLRSIQMSQSTREGHTYLDPIKELIVSQKSSMDQVTDQISNLLMTKQNSSRKGKLSEILSIHCLEKYYPTIEFMDMAKTPHSGDCHGLFPEGKVMYEFKDYSGLVGLSEIHKFHRDLKSTGIRNGIMVSNVSMISGKKRVSWDIVEKDTIVVYVAGLGANCIGSVVGTELMRALQEALIYDREKGWILRNKCDLDFYIERFGGCVDKLQENLRKMSSFKQTIQDTQSRLSTILDPLRKELWEYELSLRETFHHMVGLRSEIIEERPSHPFDKENALESIDPKHRSLYEKIYHLCESYDLSINEGGEWCGYKDDDLLFKTHTTKQKVDIYIRIKNDRINLSLSKESYKETKTGKWIVISLKDHPDIWDHLESRLKESNNI
tara:strand:+ start:669 stop:1910 length:1242 start_codon:yes stop_codon:yes gene_type:complete